jgi:hypothetical protein
MKWWVLVQMIGFISTYVTHSHLITFKYSAAGVSTLYGSLSRARTHARTHESSPGNAIKTQELELQITPNITHEESLPITL